jgi:hypothetical protein
MMLATAASAKLRQTVAKPVFPAYRLLALRIVQMNASNVSRLAHGHLRPKAKPLAAILAAPLGDRTLLDTRLVRTRTSARSASGSGRWDSHVVHGVHSLRKTSVPNQAGRRSAGLSPVPRLRPQQCGVDR